MKRPPISVTLITFNEEKKIATAIQSVQWAEEILVVDAGSQDKTVEIAKSLNAKVVSHPWLGYGQQKNYARELAMHDWILNLDADEVVSKELGEEICHVLASFGMHAPWGYCFPRKTFYLGHFIRYGGWYPNYLVRLAHRNFSRWTEPYVHEELVVDGGIGTLHQPLHHFAFSSIKEQVLTNLNFSQLGAQNLQKKGKFPSIFRLIFKPIGKWIETYFLKRGFLDGLPGFIISINAAYSMFLKYAFLWEVHTEKKED